jgi:hypothetical protein
MKVKAIKCKDCGTTIFSRYKHDKTPCWCGSLEITGGPNVGDVFIRDRKSAYDTITLDLGKEVDETVLLRDYLYKENKLGIIKEDGSKP